MVTGTDVDAAITRVASGSVGLPEAAEQAGETATVSMEERNADSDHGCASAGG